MRKTLLAVLFLGAACGGSDGSEPVAAVTTASPAPTSTASAATSAATTTSAPTTTVADAAPGDPCAHVIDGTVEWSNGTATFTATVRSADTGWDKYADAWIVRGPAGVTLGERVLAHPHENEQPFTRSLSGVEIPEGVAEVEVAAHDSVDGFCGDTFALTIPARP